MTVSYCFEFSLWSFVCLHGHASCAKCSPRSPVSRLQAIPKSPWSESFANQRCQRSQSQSRSQRPQDLFVWSLLKAAVKMKRMKSVLRKKLVLNLNKTPIFESCTAWNARHRRVNALGMCGFKRHGHGPSWKRSWIHRISVVKTEIFVWTSMSSSWKSWSKKRRLHVPLRAKRALTTRRIRRIVWTNTSKKLSEDVRWSKAASVVSSSHLAARNWKKLSEGPRLKPKSTPCKTPSTHRHGPRRLHDQYDHLPRDPMDRLDKMQWMQWKWTER